MSEQNDYQRGYANGLVTGYWRGQTGTMEGLIGVLREAGGHDDLIATLEETREQLLRDGPEA